eukprot:gb/GECH01014812.1/.p1 GENE.gb/GECH01014812.1/~~gb/GECH01014812.1/.p1  ORF type:complete len:751 (+),score=125.83 gb/GECH01014812.1/:1-2253(+)
MLRPIRSFTRPQPWKNLSSINSCRLNFQPFLATKIIYHNLYHNNTKTCYPSTTISNKQDYVFWDINQGRGFSSGNPVDSHHADSYNENVSLSENKVVYNPFHLSHIHNTTNNSTGNIKDKQKKQEENDHKWNTHDHDNFDDEEQEDNRLPRMQKIGNRILISLFVMSCLGSFLLFFSGYDDISSFVHDHLLLFGYHQHHGSGEHDPEEHRMLHHEGRQSKPIFRFLAAFITLFLVFRSYLSLPSDFFQESEERPQQHIEDEVARLHEKNAHRLTQVLLRNGGLYVKVGQFLSTLDFLLPPVFVHTLSRCQDQAYPYPLSSVKKMFEEEMGHPISFYFSEFSDEPIAAGSLAQVHWARLWSGAEVAVKVQYPDLYQTLPYDMFGIRLCIGLYRLLWSKEDIEPLLDYFQRNLVAEMDFRREALNNRDMQRCWKQGPSDDDDDNDSGRDEDGKEHNQVHRRSSKVVAPHVYGEISCRSILTMEYVDGVKVTDVEEIRRRGMDPAAVSDAISDVFARQLFVSGFVHSDPHPGNILVRPMPVYGDDGQYHDDDRSYCEPQVVLIDHGLYHQYSDDTRHYLAELWQDFMKTRPAAKETEAETIISKATKAFNTEEKPATLLLTLLTMIPLEQISPDRLIQNCHPDYLFDNTEMLNDRFISIIKNLGEFNRDMLMTFKTQQLLRQIVIKLQGYRHFPIQSSVAASSLLNEKQKMNMSLWQRVKSNIEFFYFKLITQWHILRFRLVQSQWLSPIPYT